MQSLQVQQVQLFLPLRICYLLPLASLYQSFLRIQIFLDIHGAKNTEQFDVDIGTDEKRNLNGKTEILNNLIKELKRNEIKNIGIDKKFKANTLHTLTKKIAINTNIACMQIEFTKKYRDINQIQNLEKALNAIINWIKNNRS